MRIHYITATVTPTEKFLSPMIGKRKKKRREKRIYIYMIVSRNNFNAGLTMPAPLWGGWQSRIMVVGVLQRIKDRILIKINRGNANGIWDLLSDCYVVKLI